MIDDTSRVGVIESRSFDDVEDRPGEKRTSRGVV